ncbi:ornithine carbamoyltransferase, partial [Peptococcaceae bacterium]|nr:ornithine carbamoyltransferase [Peptococcaceae bacterium]
YEPDQTITMIAKDEADRNNADIVISNDPFDAVKDADVVVTDVWASMGQESEAEDRAKAFKDYQVNSKLVSNAKPDFIFLHCLPAHRGEEVTSDVIDGVHSVVWDEAENRLHVQKAVLALLL